MHKAGRDIGELAAILDFIREGDTITSCSASGAFRATSAIEQALTAPELQRLRPRRTSSVHIHWPSPFYKSAEKRRALLALIEVMCSTFIRLSQP